MAFMNRLRSLKRPFICAEGYLFEMERRGWVQVGPFVPMVVLNDPAAVKQLHREFVRCGSDSLWYVSQCELVTGLCCKLNLLHMYSTFTYYAHREKVCEWFCLLYSLSNLALN